MTQYAIEAGYDEQDILFASQEECEAWMKRWAESRYPQPITFRYSAMYPDDEGILRADRWKTATFKGGKVRPPTAEEAAQDEIDQVAYYRKIGDMHSTQPVSAPLWFAPTRYEGF